MSDTPKRSVRETIGQLLIIALLIALIVGAVIYARRYIDAHNASDADSTKATFNFSCCTAFNTQALYHPGEVVRLSWTPVEALPGDYPQRTITLTALLSTPFDSVKDLKSSTTDGAFNLTSGPFIAAADQLQVSNRSGLTPNMSIRIPGNATTGYYEIVTKASQTGFSNTGGLIIKIRR
jgi:hypothetical protein